MLDVGRTRLTGEKTVFLSLSVVADDLGDELLTVHWTFHILSASSISRTAMIVHVHNGKRFVDLHGAKQMNPYRSPSKRN